MINKEHSFQKISKDMKEDKIKSVIYLCGVEQYLVDWSIDILVTKYINPATKTMDLHMVNMENETPSDAISSCETVPMFSNRKIVLIKNINREFKKEILQYIGDVPPSCCLIITSVEKDKDLAKACTTYDFDPLEQRQLVAFIAKRFKGGNIHIERGLISQIINKSGYYNKDIDYTLYNLEGDLKKVIAHSNGVEITEMDIESGISENIEHGVFKLMDALSNNKKDEAFRLLNDLLLTGESPFKLLANIVSQLELMLQVKELMESGKRQGDIVNLLKIHEFRVKKAMGF
ncbi:MAG: DNA polymerase III subunit delta, partial [Anaerovoracaceae bacterium]